MIVTPNELQTGLWAVEFEVHQATQLPETVLAEQVFALSQYDVERLNLPRETLGNWDTMANACRALSTEDCKLLPATKNTLTMLGSALQYYIDTEGEALNRVYAPYEIHKLEAYKRRLRTQVARDMLSTITDKDIVVPSLWTPDTTPLKTGLYL